MRAPPSPLAGLAALLLLAAAACGPGEPAGPATAGHAGAPVAAEPAPQGPVAPARAPGSIPTARDGEDPSGDAGALPGRWRPLAGDDGPGPLDAAQRARAEELATLGYVSGTRPPSAGDGVSVLDPVRVQPGLDLVVSGHAPEAVLMRNDGSVLHAWRCTAAEAFPGREGADAPTVQCWRRARLLPDGKLLAIYESYGLVCLDRDSRVLWSFPALAHHDLDCTPDGRILVLVRRVGIVPRVDAAQAVAEDYVCELAPDGRLLSAVSLLECLEAGEGRATALGLVRDTLAWTTGDLFHTNTLELVTGPGVEGSPSLRPGDVLVSLRNLDRIGVVDLAAKRFRWTRTGPFRAQHDPTLLADGRLLLFDNQGLARQGVEERSRAIELDLATGEVVWSWSGSDDDPLWSRTCGTAQRLANGNTLVVESDGGRAFEVTRAGEVVWRWNSPYRAGERGRFVATLFDLVRLPPDVPLDWLPADAPR